jgi:tRNA G37 N-methylase Trm5
LFFLAKTPAEVYAFEPDPVSIPMLQSNLKLNRQDGSKRL